MAKVYLSPSNQADNIGYGNYGTEKSRMIELAEKLKEKLINKFDVKVSNYDSSLSSRATESNNWGSDIYVSLHSNAGGGRGCEVYAYSAASKGNILAHDIYDKVSNITPSGDRGVKYNELYETSTPSAPACLVETIFHDNKDDVEWYLNNIDDMATAIAKGIYQYFGIEYDKASTGKINYRGHTQDEGWNNWVKDGVTCGTVGKSKRLEAIQIDCKTDVYAKAHIQSKGWVDYGKITKDTVIGTTGQSLRLENLCFKGDFKYRVHIQKTGWTPWTNADGISTLGTSGQSLRIEAIEIK